MVTCFQDVLKEINKTLLVVRKKPKIFRRPRSKRNNSSKPQEEEEVEALPVEEVSSEEGNEIIPWDEMCKPDVVVERWV